MAAGGIQATALQLAPNPADYTLTPVISPAIATLDSLSGLQGLSAFPSALQVQPAAATAVALPRALPVSYAQIMPASDLAAPLTNVTSLPSIQPSVTHASAIPLAAAGASGIGVLAPLPSTSVSAPAVSEVKPVAESTLQTETSSAAVPTSSSWLVCFSCTCITQSYFLFELKASFFIYINLEKYKCSINVVGLNLPKRI